MLETHYPAQRLDREHESSLLKKVAQGGMIWKLGGVGPTRCGIERMRGEDRHSGSLFSYVDLEARVAADHPLRPIETIVDDALGELSGEVDIERSLAWAIVEERPKSILPLWFEWVATPVESRIPAWRELLDAGVDQRYRQELG